MKKMRLRVLSGLICLLLLSLVACTPGATPTPTPSQAPVTPKPSPTSSPAPVSPSPTATPVPVTPKPSPTSPPVSFAGKSITLVVPFAAGGATDIIARIYSRYLPKQMPGQPMAIVRDMPGGAATIGANYVWGAKPDGLTALVVGVSVCMAQVLGMKAAKFDLLKMPASVGVATSGLFYIKPGIIDKAEDILKAKGLIFGDTPGTGGLIFVAAKELLDIPIPKDKVVLAYTGSGASRLAFLSGEINMAWAPTADYTSVVSELVKNGEAMVLFQGGVFDDSGILVRDPALAEFPTVKEFYQTLYGKAPSGMAWEAYKGAMAATKSFDKSLVLPPGTPDNIVKAYWAAAEKMVKDPGFMKEADFIGKGARWGAGEAYDKAFKANFGMDPEVVTWFREILPSYGVAVE